MPRSNHADSDDPPTAARMQVFPTLARFAWVSPCSALGLLLALPVPVAGGSARRVAGVLEVAVRRGRLPERTPLRRLPFAAITLGHVVVGVSTADLDRLRAHEHAHVRQYERWGAAFLLAYPIAGLVALLRGGHPYRNNRFEREAHLAAERHGNAT
jgi:hypothetical protein